jgi:predicted DNA-binding protein (MmcQ/YjbR family)
MITPEKFRNLALSFEGAEEAPHFEKTSFRIAKKIFATLNEKEDRATLKLSAIDQSVFCSFNASIIFPVPTAWGKQGWTHIILSLIPEEMVEDILTCSFCEVAPKKIADKYRIEPI